MKTRKERARQTYGAMKQCAAASQLLVEAFSISTICHDFDKVLNMHRALAKVKETRALR
jgi:hypothetical protein